MDLKDETVKTFDDARLAINEGLHKALAMAEQKKRDLAGDHMTVQETAESMASQGKNEVLAAVDETKRESH